MEHLRSLSSDLLLERQKLKQSLKMLEEIIVASGIEFKVKNEVLEHFQKEIFRLASGLGKIEAIAKNISLSVKSSGLEQSKNFLKKISSFISEMAIKFGKPIELLTQESVGVALGETGKIDHSIYKLIESIVEFSIEGERERVLRKKKPVSVCRLNFSEEKHGNLLTILVDGNGIMPPIPDSDSVSLSQEGVWVSFQGKPGKWSGWFVHLPDEKDILSVYSIVCGNVSFLVPVRSVLGVIQNESELDPFVKKIYLHPDASIHPWNSKGKQGFFLEVASGLNRVYLLSERSPQLKDVIIKEMAPSFTAGGVFKSVGIEIQKENENLELVLNPHYLVYNHRNEQN